MSEAQEARNAVLEAKRQALGFKTQAGNAAQAAIAAQTEATTALNAIVGAKEQIDSALAGIRPLGAEATTLHGEIATKKEAVQVVADEVARLLEDCKGDKSALGTATENSERLVKELEQHEERLKEMRADYSELHKRVEGLLPGAASGALASAFRERRTVFRVPRLWWSALGVASIVALIFVSALPGALLGEPLIAEGGIQWLVLLEQFLLRLPFVGPLVWLAIHANRQAQTIARLEEDYGYKEALSKAFEGYKKQMQGIEGTQDATHPLRVLCNGVLASLSQPPGRHFDAKPRDATPLNAMLDALDESHIKAIAEPMGIEAGKAVELLRRFLMPSRPS